MQLRLAFPLQCTRCGNDSPGWVAWRNETLVGCNECKPSWRMGEVTRVEQPTACHAPGRNLRVA